jgi:uncharacterized membrane protein YesL
MGMGLKAGFFGLRHFFKFMSTYIWANALWILLTLPVLTAPAAWAGLCRMSYYAYRTPSITFQEFWAGFRAHWKGGIVLSLIGCLVVMINIVNLLGYTRDTSLQGMVMRIAWTLTLVSWFGIQLIAFPMLNAMKQPTLWGAYRNAAVLVFRSPLFALGILVVSGLVILFTTLFPAAIALVTGAALASIGNAAVLNRLVAAGIQEMPTSAEGEPARFDEAYS